MSGTRHKPQEGRTMTRSASQVNSFRTRDGRLLTWSGRNICVCTRCDEIFNSPAAFDAHIRTNRETGERVHDFSWMPRNNAGRLVTALRETGGE